MTKKSLEIYEHYKIMLSLREHQMKVAAVAQQICKSREEKLNIAEVVSACLIHDMGNIIKFDLNYFPQFLEPQGLKYWNAVKQEFEKKYGKEEHRATLLIAKEIGVSKKTISYLSAIGFSKTTQNLSEKSFEKKICCYADQRVGPFSILSVEERLKEGRERYKDRKDKSIASTWFEIRSRDLKQLEEQIFKNSKIQPFDITDDSIKNYLRELINFALV
ncbi:HD domain-containing protein [Candidatus Wolfebacteria bacterium]|nr:HD domain-containing protein [Candidatus Wolfebacteria bacterium]